MNIYVSKETIETFEKRKINAVIKYAYDFKLATALIKAIIKKESAGNFWATRYEHHLKKAGWYNRTIKGIDTVLDYHYCSFGLMQIMYGMARHYGMIGSPFKLYDPDIGIKYGCKHLAWLWKRYKGDLLDVISAYNQGNTRKDGPYYVNQDYVDVIINFYREYGGQI